MLGERLPASSLVSAEAAIAGIDVVASNPVPRPHAVLCRSARSNYQQSELNQSP